MNILNLYCGIGGNRELWGDEHKITAVELNQKVADEYKSRYPNDLVIVSDAHEYLLHNFKSFDFIWSSPPCPTHSRTNYFTQAIKKIPTYPDMKLWQEIIYLNQFCKKLWIIENVIPYYEPFLPKYQQIGRHFIWSNFLIPNIKMPKNEIGTMMKQYVGTGKHAHDKSLEDRNAVNSELGLHILNSAIGKFLIKKDYKQFSLFENGI
jgi:DNA (cytosine-5)-methyltransferase 1